MVAVSSPKLIFGWGQPQGMVLPYQEVRGLTPKFVSEIFVGAPNFASKNISDIRNFALLISDMTTKWDFFPTFASCGDRTSQFFPLIWLTWPDPTPNFTSKLDVTSKPPPPPPPPPRPPYLELPLGDSEGMTCQQRGYS